MMEEFALHLDMLEEIRVMTCTDGESVNEKLEYLKKSLKDSRLSL